MAKQKANRPGGLVYSTDPDFKIAREPDLEQETADPGLQKLSVRLDKKHRAGKITTIIEGFIGREADRQDLGKKLKTFCGTGGSVKDGDIMVQGDNRDKVLQWLLINKFTASKKI